MGGRHFSNSATLDHHIGTSKLTQRPNGLKTSRSDPILVPPVPASASAMVINLFYIKMQTHSYSTYKKIDAVHVNTGSSSQY